MRDSHIGFGQFDSKGDTGGCQAAYTVIPPRNSSKRCNETFSTPTTLSVQGTSETGPLTQYGWPDQVWRILF